MVFKKKIIDEIILLVARTFCLVYLACKMLATLFNNLGEINLRMAKKMFYVLECKR